MKREVYYIDYKLVRNVMYSVRHVYENKLACLHVPSLFKGNEKSRGLRFVVVIVLFYYFYSITHLLWTYFWILIIYWINSQPNSSPIFFSANKTFAPSPSITYVAFRMPQRGYRQSNALLFTRGQQLFDREKGRSADAR